MNQDEDKTLFADGFDDALIGIDYEGRAIYDAEIMLNILVEQGMEDFEAREYLEFNVFGAALGAMTPIYMFPIDEEELCASDAI